MTRSASSVSASASAVTRAAPRVLRAYFECRHGQLHVTHAVPAGGGFDEATAVICLPASGTTGAVFAPLLAGLGRDRSVYAVDLPGSGMSDGAAGVESAAVGLLDLLDNLRLRRVNLVAVGDAEALARRLRAERAAAIGKCISVTSSAELSVPSLLAALGND